MPPAPTVLHLRSRSSAFRPLAAYSLAGRLLICDRRLTELAAFRVDAGALARRSGVPRAPAGPFPEVCFRGPARVGDRELEVCCRHGPGGYLLEVAAAGRFWLAADGGQLCCLEEAELARAVLLGPCLALILALGGVFGLHASAVDTAGGRVLALCGLSGAGKSTLARRLRDAGWRRRADDLLPLAGGPRGPEARLRFPQFSLPREQQADPAEPPAAPLAAVVCLTPTEGEPGPELRRLTPRQGAVAVARHTVASRLFAPPLARRHLDFCAGVAAAVPLYELAYPQRLDQLDRLAAMVGDLLRGS